MGLGFFWTLFGGIILGIAAIAIVVLLIYCFVKMCMSSQKRVQAVQDSTVGGKLPSTLLTVIAISFIITCINPTVHAYSSPIDLTSHKDCRDRSAAWSSQIHCDTDGLYTRLHVQLSHAFGSNETVSFSTVWSVVGDERVDSDFKLNHTNVCNEKSCLKLQNPVYVNMTILKSHIGMKLIPTHFTIEYGHYFDVVGASYNDTVHFGDTLFNASAPDCTGISTEYYSQHIGTFRGELGIDLDDYIVNQDGCGTHPDLPLALGSTLRFSENGFNSKTAALCYTCPGSGISEPTMARSIPFGPHCEIYKISSDHTQITEVLIELRTEGRVTEKIVVVSVDNNIAFVKSNNAYARAKISRISLSSNHTRVRSRKTNIGGYIVICGNKTSDLFREMGTHHYPHENEVGWVPTSLSSGHDASWYIMPGTYHNKHVLNGCGTLGLLGAMNRFLYEDDVAITSACADGSLLTGRCVPGLYDPNTFTPCRVSSVLNAYSDSYLTWVTGGKVGPPPPIPSWLTKYWNSDNPNMHIASRRGTKYLMFADRSQTRKPTANIDLFVDVGTTFAPYAQEQQGIIINHVDTRCQYSKTLSEGAMTVQACNRGSSAANFTVTVLSCTDTITGIVFDEGSLPIGDSFYNITNLKPDNCVYLPAWTFTVQNESKLFEQSDIIDAQKTFPYAFSTCNINITSTDKNVILGRMQPEQIKCYAYEETPPALDDVLYELTATSFNFGCVMRCESRCTTGCIVMYSTIAFVSLLLILVLVLSCLLCSKKNENKKMQTVDKTQ